MRVLSFGSIALLALGFNVGCGLSSSLVPGVDDTSPNDDAGPVQDATADAPVVVPVKDAAPDSPIVSIKDATADAPVVVIKDAEPDAPIRGRILPDAAPPGNDGGEGDDSSVVVVADGSTGDDATTGDDASEDASTPVADAAPACYTVCDNQCTSCKWVCVNTPGCSDTERETCSLKCTTVQSDCHTVCDTHGCGGYKETIP